MNNTDSHPRFETQPNGKKNGEFKFQIDPKIGESLQGGLQGGFEAIGQLLTGFVQSIKDAVGPELMRNLSAGQWLATVAASLEEIASAWQVGQPTPSGKSGELACFLERLAEEVQGSRVEGQEAALRERLAQALAMIESDQSDARIVSKAAGYFQAAAKSAMPMQVGEKK